MHFEKTHRREPTEPQLATMVDVFSILIIFLIAGTTMDASIISVNADWALAFTQSKATPTNAIQVSINDSSVILSINSKAYALSSFSAVSPQNSDLIEFASLIKSEAAKTNQSPNAIVNAKANVETINLVATSRVNYGQIFSVIRYLRGLGIKSINLIGLAKLDRDS